MTDHFSSSMSYFATYKSTNPADFENNNVSGMNLNYLSPRHGSVVNITTEQYNKLIAKYGKVTYDTTNVPTGKDVNDYLVARYFTNSDANNDSTGNGYNLTSNNVEMTTDYFGRIAAHFIGTAKDDLSDPKATKQGDSYKKQIHMRVYQQPICSKTLILTVVLHFRGTAMQTMQIPADGWTGRRRSREHCLGIMFRQGQPGNRRICLCSIKYGIYSR